MSVLSLTQSLKAIAVNLNSSFLGVGGTPPYQYSVRPNGAGGSINGSTGLYTAPALVSSNPKQLYDVIQVKDSAGGIAVAQILIGTPLLLFCEIIQSELGLANGRVYLWDQKIPEPTDAGLYVAVSCLSCKPFSNTNKFDGSESNSNQDQSVNMYANLQIDIISRDSEARDRKEEVILALNSNYAQSQQEANSFYIGKLPPGSQFLNLSSPDGAAIPYRYNISVAMQYFFTKTTAVLSFDSFQTPQVNTNP